MFETLILCLVIYFGCEKGVFKMKRIYLFCSAGMSTSMLSSNMQDVADEHEVDIEIQAFQYEKLVEVVEEYHPDCILLGPQIEYLYEETVSMLNHSIPVLVVNPEDYGMLNGENVLKSAIKQIRSWNKKKGE